MAPDVDVTASIRSATTRPWCDWPAAPPPHARVRQWLDDVGPGVGSDLARPVWAHLPSGPVSPGVSVVMPAHAAVEHLPASVGSLLDQTLDPAHYEVVVVLNGPDDGAWALLQTLQEGRGRGVLRILRVAATGVSSARNAGLVAATRSHVTFVDADDRVTPRYLELLWAEAADDVVPVAEMRDVVPGSATPIGNYTTAAVARSRGRDRGIAALPQVASYNAAKLVPTPVARRIGYDESLVSGEDVVFMTTLLTHLRPMVRVVGEDALYLRTVMPGSLSRRRLSGDEEVERRLEVCRRLVGWRAHLDDDMAAIVDGKLRTQVRAIAVRASREAGLQAAARSAVEESGLAEHWSSGL